MGVGECRETEFTLNYSKPLQISKNVSHTEVSISQN